MLYRFTSFLTGAALLILAGLVYSILQYAGFPDGHLTELDRARDPLYTGLILISIAHAAFFLALGWLAPAKGRKRLFWLAVTVFLICFIATAITDFVLGLYLDHGTGG